MFLVSLFEGTPHFTSIAAAKATPKKSAQKAKKSPKKAVKKVQEPQPVVSLVGVVLCLMFFVFASLILKWTAEVDPRFEMLNIAAHLPADVVALIPANPFAFLFGAPAGEL
jgi:uncharacterized integral membrane protein